MLPSGTRAVNHSIFSKLLKLLREDRESHAPRDAIVERKRVRHGLRTCEPLVLAQRSWRLLSHVKGDFILILERDHRVNKVVEWNIFMASITLVGYF
jgi:hypothetical protein